MTLHLLFSHSLTPEQMADAEKTLKTDTFKELPQELQKVWSNIPPDIASLDEILKPLKLYLKANAKKGDYVLIQGDFGAVCTMVAYAKELDLIPVYATTARESQEDEIDGKIVKRSVFRHIRFRAYR